MLLAFNALLFIPSGEGGIHSILTRNPWLAWHGSRIGVRDDNPRLGRHDGQIAGSRISQRMASICLSNSGDSVVPQMSRFSSSWATEVTPMMVLATCHLV